MARPSDFWPNFKKLWYNDKTGELQEPHKGRLLQQGISLSQIADMEKVVKGEIEDFHQLDRENPVISGENYNDRLLRLRNNN